MPLFSKKKPAKDLLTQNQQSPSHNANDSDSTQQVSTPEANGGGKVNKAETPPQAPRPKLVFHCQQAQGSPTGIISGFTNVKELYKKIAECYDLDVSEILFCTLNTHKVDMNRLLGGQIGLEDFIFAHVKGQPKEVEVTKTEDALGLTITDNGAGYAFIKRIKEGSIMDKVPAPLIEVGDHIEKIDGKSMVGCRHFEVAKALKEIPRGKTFLLRVVAPLKSGFSNIGPSSGKKGSGDLGSGKKTLRLRSTGPATVQEAMPEDVMKLVIDKINGLLESFMGINDTELATTIWELGSKADNSVDFAVALDGSELADFGFTDDFIFDLWGIVSDAKQGRLATPATTEFNEQF